MDLQTLLQEHEELQGELRGSTDKAKKASCEVTDKNTDVLGLQRCNAWWDVKVSSWTHFQMFVFHPGCQ